MIFKRVAGMTLQLTSDRLLVVDGGKAVMTLCRNNPSFSVYLDIFYIISFVLMFGKRI